MLSEAGLWEIDMTVKMLVMDVDGTLTDGKINVSANGELFKSFNVRDGYGIKNLCKKHGIIAVIISGRDSEMVNVRSEELGIEEVHQAISDKKDKLIELSFKYGLEPNQIAYIGDDVNDLPAMDFAGLTFAPKDSHPHVKEKVNHVLESNGGCGAVRECIDFIIGSLEGD